MTLNDSRGFALPTTVLLVTILTVMLAAAFTRTSSDYQIADGSQFMEEALAIAQGGLDSYVENTTSRPSDGDSVRINVTGGYAWVHVNSLQRPADQDANETFVLSSTGYVIKATQGSTPVAERTVAQMAFWQTGGNITRPAAWVAAEGVDNKRSSTVEIEGDYYWPDTVGLRTSDLNRTSNITLSGVPVDYDESGNEYAVALETGIDWERIRSGGLECANTSIFSGSWNSSWSQYCIDGDFDYQKYYGTGLLVVTGDLRMTGRWNYAYWFGVILVGGKIKFRARNTRIYGMVVSGLNEQIPSLPNVDKTKVGENFRNVRIRYYAPYVDAATNYLTGLVPIENAWMDNWAAY